jgi:hypothetical protein
MQLAENGRAAGTEEESKKGKVSFYAAAPGLLKTKLSGYLATGKDPREGAEVAVHLILDTEGKYEGGTYWEFEGGEMRLAPW